MAQRSAKASAKSVKQTAKVSANAAAKGLIAAIAAGGQVVVLLLAAISTGYESRSRYGDKLYVEHVMQYLDGMGNIVSTSTAVGRHLNGLYVELIGKIGQEASNLNGAAISEVVYDDGESDSRYNPVEVLAVYSVKATSMADGPVTLALFE